MRYADVLLMFIEAKIGAGNETIDPTALGYYDQVRARAGLPTGATIVTKDQLLNERRVELAFENHRLFDLVRFGAALDVLSTFSSNNNYGFSSTDLLLPIPQVRLV